MPREARDRKQGDGEARGHAGSGRTRALSCDIKMKKSPGANPGAMLHAGSSAATLVTVDQCRS
jgi:hypothetical protein